MKYLLILLLLIFSVICFANEKKVLICVAMDVECDLVIKDCNFKQVKRNIYENDKAILIKTGIGKVNAAMWTQYAIDHYNISYIFNYGFVGDNTKKLKLFDLILPEKIMQHDFNMMMDGYKIGHVQGQDKYIYENNIELFNKMKINIPVKKVEYLLTGDRFIPENIRGIDNSITDMEGYAIARVAHNANIPVLFLKFNSNECSVKGIKDYEKQFDIMKFKMQKTIIYIIKAM